MNTIWPNLEDIFAQQHEEEMRNEVALTPHTKKLWAGRDERVKLAKDLVTPQDADYRNRRSPQMQRNVIDIRNRLFNWRNRNG